MTALMASCWWSLLAATAPADAAAYMDLRAYLSHSHKQADYDRMVTDLEDAFARSYGGSQVAGFDNLKSLRFRCSVSRFSGHVQQCVWVFAGSHEDIDAHDGSFFVDTMAFACPIYVDATGEQLVSERLGAQSTVPLLDRPLTATGGTARTALATCLR